jgi:hypothetical protein
MTSDPTRTATGCDAVESRLVEAFLARRPAPREDDAHVAACAACRAIRDELAALGVALAGHPRPVPSELLVQRTQRRARTELAAALERALEEAEVRTSDANLLPPGFARECVRLLVGAVAVLPLVLLWNGFVLSLARRLFAGVVPESLLAVAGGAYVACFAAWMTFVYGSIPFVAHRRARRAPSEVTR